MLVIVACSSTSSITSFAIFILPVATATGLFRVGLLTDIVNRDPEINLESCVSHKVKVSFINMIMIFETVLAVKLKSTT